MSDPVSNRPELSEAQELFVARVAAAEPPARHALEAPPGTGKGTAAVEIVRRLSLADPQLRVLLLCPAPLVQQFAARIGMVVESVKVEIIDRPRYRELEAAAPLDASPFPAGTVIILSIDLAKHADVARGLLLTHWQLLIVDEAHQLTGQRDRVVHDLLEGRVDRAVLMSATLPPHLPQQTVVSRWSAAPVSAAADGNGVTFRPVAVKYTAAEEAVFAAATALANDLARSGFDFVGNVVRNNADSSLYALEQTLREMRNRAAHGEPPDAAENLPPPSLVVPGAERVLAAMDDVEVDSKTEALYALLTAQAGPPGHSSAIVVTRYRRTAEYLAEALAGRGFRSRCLTGNTTPDEIARAVHQLSDPGVTVLTPTSLRGFELPPIATWVIYERGDDRSLYVALTRTRPAESDQPITVFTFERPEPRENG